MDRFTRTADIIKAYYSYKQTADSATFVKKVCSFFDFIKDESLSDADLNLLLFLANEAGIPQYYDLLKSKFTNAEIGDESINSLTMSALFHDASLIRGDSKLHRYQKHVLDSFVATQRNRYDKMQVSMRNLGTSTYTLTVAPFVNGTGSVLSAPAERISFNDPLFSSPDMPA